MIRSQARNLLKTIRAELEGRKEQKIHYISDSANWSFRWDAHYITRGLEKHPGIKTATNTVPWDLRHQIILFGNRFAFFKGPRDRLHLSNTLFLIWFHGDPNDPNPDMRSLFGQLPEAFDKLEKVVITCDISRRILREQGVADDKLVTIPLGVDTNRFIPAMPEGKNRIRQKLGIPPEAFCIGSFQKDGDGWGEGEQPKLVKGPDILLQVLERLKKIHPQLMVLLTGPARGYVKKGLERLGIPYRHHLLEDYPQIVPYYQALDLYLITSRAEGGPKAILEGWACGVPVVSTRVGMPADLIRHRRNGMLADVEAVAALTEHCQAMIEDKDLHDRCKKTGLETVQNYDWQAVADQYHAMIKPHMR